jgi:hypothetical protein
MLKQMKIRTGSFAGAVVFAAVCAGAAAAAWASPAPQGSQGNSVSAGKHVAASALAAPAAGQSQAAVDDRKRKKCWAGRYGCGQNEGPNVPSTSTFEASTSGISAGALANAMGAAQFPMH